MLKIGIIIVLCLICLQMVESKKVKKPVTTIDKATSAVSNLLEDVTDFLKDVLQAITDIFRTKKKRKTPNDDDSWSMMNIFKYTTKNIKTGYKVIKDSISVLNMARSAVDDVAPILPNVPPAKFIEELLKHLVPELMKTQVTNE